MLRQDRKSWGGVVGAVLIGLFAAAMPEVHAQSAALADSFRIEKDQKLISHIPAVVYTADGGQFLCGTSHGKIMVWDRKTGKAVDEITCTENPVSAVAVDLKGRYAVWAEQKGGLGSMDIKQKKTLAKADGKSGFIAICPDGKHVAVAIGKTVEIKEIETMKTVKTLSSGKGAVQQIAWNSTGKMISYVDDQGELFVFDLDKDYKVIYQVKKSSALYAVAFAPDSTRMAYGGHEKIVYQYDFATQKEEAVSKDQPYYITALGYSPDGTVIAVGDESCDVWLYEIQSRKRFFHSKHHVECWLNSVTFTPDGQTVTFGCRPNTYEGKPTVYDHNTTQEAAQAADVKACDAQIKTCEEEIKKDAENRELLKKLEDLRQQRNVVYQKRVGELKESFNVNQWTITK